MLTQQNDEQNEALFDVIIDSNIMVAMRDGVRLATDIHRPARRGHAASGKFPVVVERTPYDKTGVRISERTATNPEPLNRAAVAAYFVRHGYVVVIQDLRGRYRSEGTFTKYLGEANDGCDTLAWIAAQPWCNGSIGTFGLSYCAHTQTAMISLKPPGLKSMQLDCGGFSNAYRGGIRNGGTFELKQATWAFKQAALSPVAEADPVVRAALKAEDIKTWFRAMPWKRGHSPLRWVPEYEDYFFDQWERGTFDDYWRQPEFYAAGHYADFKDVPVLLMCGWWDPYAQTTTDNYVGISSQAGGRAWMIMGPWTHGQRSITWAGDVDFGPQAIFEGQIAEDYLALRLDWFNRSLKPGEIHADIPAVRYFRMGGGSGRRNTDKRLDHGGSWRRANHWPVPGTEFRPYYLHEDGELSPTPPAADNASRTYDFDPANPVPTIGGQLTSGEPVMYPGAWDQRATEQVFGAQPPFLPLAARHDVLVFQTPPLDEDIEITGPIVVRLWISSSAPDTDFTAKLIDCHPSSADYPQGYAMNLTSGILRCRYRKSWEKPEMLSPGEVAEIVIEPMPTSNLFKKGHRIRIDISSSNFPHFDVNPNTGDPEGRAQRMQIATNTVHTGRLHASHIILPVVASSTPLA